MLEPPSDELLERLRAWHLCQPVDLRRARRLVRRLSRDLPAFDSVWIDALVQQGRLTPYQARVLEGEVTTELQVGSYLLLDEVGRSSLGGTWQARRLDGGERFALKHLFPSSERQAALVPQGHQLAEIGRQLRSPHVAAPIEFWETPLGCAFVSPWVDGTPLNELLLRRGRFPSRIVAEVARQLATGLAECHREAMIHGDIRLSHVRINRAGQCVLVEAGLRQVIEPEMSLHAHLSLEGYDGVAPERIGVGQPPTAASDLYALGCLLWQLLAGRPPFAVADPLAKLAAHQTRRIEDVREWAPETPAPLAELITRLTEREPAHRPASAASVADELSRWTLPGKTGVRRFRQQYDLAVPHLRSQETASPLTRGFLITTALLLAAGSVWLMDGSHRQQLLSLPGRWWDQSAETRPAAPEVIVNSASGLLPLPSPTPDGTLLLTEPGPYAASTLRWTGRLLIQAAPGVCPEILIRDQPLRVACEEVHLEGIQLRRDSLWLAAAAPSALCLIQSQRITLQGCLWDTGEKNPRRPADLVPTGMAWKLIEPLDSAAGLLTIRNSVFLGQGTAILAHDTARRIIAENVLRVGGAPWLDLVMTQHDRPVQLDCTHLTLRDSHGLVRCQTGPVDPSRPIMEINATECVLALKTSEARTSSLVTWVSEAMPVLSAAAFRWNGESTLVLPETPLLCWKANRDDQGEEMDAEALEVDGLLAGRFTFTGPPTMRAADSLLAEADLPRRSEIAQGISIEQLPACLGGTPVEQPLVPLLNPPRLP